MFAKSKGNSSKEIAHKQTTTKPKPLPRTKIPAKEQTKNWGDSNSKLSVKQSNYSEKKSPSNYSSKSENTLDIKYKNPKENEPSWRSKTHDYGSKVEQTRQTEVKPRNTNLSNKTNDNKNNKNNGALPKTSRAKSTDKENIPNHQLENISSTNSSIKTDSRKSIYPTLNINEKNYEEENLRPELDSKSVSDKRNRHKSRSLLSLSTPTDSTKLSVYKINNSDKELNNEQRNSVPSQAFVDSESKVSLNSHKSGLKVGAVENLSKDSKSKSKETVTPEYQRSQMKNHNSNTGGASSHSQRINTQNTPQHRPIQNTNTYQPNQPDSVSDSQGTNFHNSRSSKKTHQQKGNLNESINNNYIQFSEFNTQNGNKIQSNTKPATSPNKGYLHIATIATITQKFGLGPMKKQQRIKASKELHNTRDTSIYNGREPVNEIRISNSNSSQARQDAGNSRSQYRGNRRSIPIRDYNMSSVSDTSQTGRGSRYTSTNTNQSVNHYPVLPPITQPREMGTHQVNTSNLDPIFRATGAENQAIAPTTFTQNGYSSKKLKIPLKTLKDFRDAYEKITQILQNGKDHILSGDYKQACSDFEFGLKLMDCVLEVCVDGLELPTLESTMCASIQEVIFKDRKTALEGFSDAQAGILPPTDIENSVPSGAPPSYTEVLRQDLLNTFAGKSNACIFGNQRSIQGNLLDTSFVARNTPSAHQLENTSQDSTPVQSPLYSPLFLGSEDLNNQVFPSHEIESCRGSSEKENSVLSSDERRNLCHGVLHSHSPSAPDFDSNDSSSLTILPSLNDSKRSNVSMSSETNGAILSENSDFNAIFLNSSSVSKHDLPEESALYSSKNISYTYINDHSREIGCSIGKSSLDTLTDLDSCFSGSSTSVSSFDFHLVPTVSLPNSALNKSVNTTSENEDFNPLEASGSLIDKDLDSPGTISQKNIEGHNPVSSTINISFNSQNLPSKELNDLMKSNENRQGIVTNLIRDQTLGNNLLTSDKLEHQNLPPPIPSITDLKIPKNSPLSQHSNFPPDVCMTARTTIKENPTTSGNQKNIEENVVIKEGKKRPPVPTPRRRFLVAKGVTDRNLIKDQTDIPVSVLAEPEMDTTEPLKSPTNAYRNIREVFNQQQLSIYSKQNNEESFKTKEKMYANTNEMQEMLKMLSSQKSLKKEQQSSFPCENNFTNSKLQKNNSVPNIKMFDSLAPSIKNSCIDFDSRNQNTKYNFERKIPDTKFTNQNIIQDKYKVFDDYQSTSKEINLCNNDENLMYIGNSDSHNATSCKNNFSGKNNTLPVEISSPENKISPNVHGAIPKTEFKKSAFLQNSTVINGSRPILKSTPESTCTSPIEKTNFKKSWSTGHGVFGPRNSKASCLKYTPSLLKEFDPLAQKSSFLSKDDLDIDLINFKQNSSKVNEEIKQILQISKSLTPSNLSNGEFSNLSPIVRRNTDDKEKYGLLDISQEQKDCQNKNKNVEIECLNSAMEVSSVKDEPNVESIYQNLTLNLLEKETCFKRNSTFSTGKDFFQNVIDNNSSSKENEMTPGRNILILQNVSQEISKTLEVTPSSATSNFPSTSDKNQYNDHPPKMSQSRQINHSVSEESINIDNKRRSTLEKVLKINDLPEDFLKLQNNNSEVREVNLKDEDDKSISKEETTEAENIPTSTIPKNECSNTVDLPEDCHAHAISPENSEDKSPKPAADYVNISNSKLEENTNVVCTTGSVVGQSEFYLKIKEETVPDLPSLAQWREILFIEEIKLYFIKSETEILSPFYRPNLQILEEISFGRNMMNPTMRLLVLPQKRTPLWSRDLTMDHVKVFKTVGGAFMFTNTDGTFVGIKFSVKTNFKKISKFMSLLTSHTYFEKEISRKNSPSKVSKLIDDLVGTKADKIRITAKDVTRQSIRTIKFAKTALGVKDQPAARSYQEPETESTFGVFTELQTMGKLLEKSIIENNIKYY